MEIAGSSTITHAYSDANVTVPGGSQTGGLVGSAFNAVIVDTHATGAVTGGGDLGDEPNLGLEFLRDRDRDGSNW